MNLTVFRLALLMTWVLFFVSQAAVAYGAAPSTITIADDPVRIIRGVHVLKAYTGSVVKINDIIETDTDFTQIEISSNLIMVMAPETKIYISQIQSGKPVRTEIILLSGWFKVFNKILGSNGHVKITSPYMSVVIENGSSILHVSDSKAEMFAENGGQLISELDKRGTSGLNIEVDHEQYARRLNGQPTKVMPRLTKEFVAEMPIIFREAVRVAPHRSKDVEVSPTKERSVNYSDIGLWLNSDLAIRKTFVRRFRSRLKDAVFFKQLDAQLGQSAEWKHVLHPRSTKRKPKPKPKPKPPELEAKPEPEQTEFKPETKRESVFSFW